MSHKTASESKLERDARTPNPLRRFVRMGNSSLKGYYSGSCSVCGMSGAAMARNRANSADNMINLAQQTCDREDCPFRGGRDPRDEPIFDAK